MSKQLNLGLQDVGRHHSGPFKIKEMISGFMIKDRADRTVCQVATGVNYPYPWNDPAKRRKAQETYDKKREEARECAEHICTVLNSDYFRRKGNLGSKL